jgi:hypothetical protein
LIDPLPLGNEQIVPAAEEMIAEHGNAAIAEADRRIGIFQCGGSYSAVQTWKLIREIIRDIQESDSKMNEYKEALKKGVFLSE